MTEGVRVVVRTQYVPERSQPPRQWFFAYQVTIANEGTEPVQLLSREWVITNGSGVEQTVVGPGVVGEQPRLGPGEAFQYVSACPLDTAVGTMKGHYVMTRDSGECFDAEVAEFVLLDPEAVN
ncbi:MAG: Co2+/Mg2+ efflux protein ApaG [Myxococcales bacterium]|nr:Co2+/Mg2+ efflux protein ApaG [Myxococcales bacterium]